MIASRLNLYDLIKRADKGVAVDGDVRIADLRRPNGSMRGVSFAPDAGLRIRAAHEALCFADFPTDPGWSCAGDSAWSLTVTIESEQGASVLAKVHGKAGAAAPVHLQWPLPVPRRFDLSLQAATAKPLHVLVGPLVTPRTELLPMLRGKGVEVGPGLNPVVLPRRGVEVSYVEKKHPRDWAATYLKRELTAAELELGNHYVVDSARFLHGFPPASLDFVFSNHVLEHLVDPIGTMVRWWQRLAPGGMLAGVVPDARFTFDWRQPAWDIADVRAQRGLEADAPTQAMYERWCRYTAPGNTPETLRARDYSIHVNYFTPLLMRRVIDDVVAALPGNGEPEPDGVFLQSVVNGKDFGFMLRKPAR